MIFYPFALHFADRGRIYHVSSIPARRILNAAHMTINRAARYPHPALKQQCVDPVKKPGGSESSRVVAVRGQNAMLSLIVDRIHVEAGERQVSIVGGDGAGSDHIPGTGATAQHSKQQS